MINISKIWCGRSNPLGDDLRYRADVHRRPVVVWNSTKRCNLSCIHCYAGAGGRPDPGELTTEQAKSLVEDLADFGVPVLLMSGGEPLARSDIFEVAKLARELGVRTVLSTNGTLITRDMAERLRRTGFSYVGVSLDGMKTTNDHFRAKDGAFEAAIKGIRNCLSAGVRTGLRFTLTKHNITDIPGIFDLIENEGIDRVCFYHLVYSGRGRSMVEDDLSHDETRGFMDYLVKKVEELDPKGGDIEALTVDNHADAAYIHLKLLNESPSRAEEAMRLFDLNGGNSSGSGIGAVDFKGFVHADQFWQHYSFGNVLERKFSEIWSDETEPLLHALRDRRRLLKGRCSRCKYLNICNGNFRVRAEAVYGDVWAPDPACYLTDGEVGMGEGAG